MRSELGTCYRGMYARGNARESYFHEVLIKFAYYLIWHGKLIYGGGRKKDLILREIGERVYCVSV